MNDICIICLNEDTEIGLMDELIRPCNCKSSLFHRSCLNELIQFTKTSKNKDTCSTCNTKYIYEPDPNYKPRLCINMHTEIKLDEKVCGMIISLLMAFILYIYCYYIFYSVAVCETCCVLFCSRCCEHNIKVFINFHIIYLLATSILTLFALMSVIPDYLNAYNEVNSNKSWVSSKAANGSFDMFFDICRLGYKSYPIYSCILILLTVILLPVFGILSLSLICLNVIVCLHFSNYKKGYRIKNLNNAQGYSTMR